MSVPSTMLNRRLVVDRPTTVKALPAWGELAPVLVEPPARLVPGKVYRVLIDPEGVTAEILAPRYAWDTPYGHGPTFESAEEASENAQDLVDSGAKLHRLYVNSAGRVVHSEQIEVSL